MFVIADYTVCGNDSHSRGQHRCEGRWQSRVDLRRAMISDLLNRAFAGNWQSAQTANGNTCGFGASARLLDVDFDAIVFRDR